MLAAFMDENIKFPYVIGVSAGANNGANFVAEQRERNKKVFVDYVNHKDYSGFKHWITGKSFFQYGFFYLIHCQINWYPLIMKLLKNLPQFLKHVLQSVQLESLFILKNPNLVGWNLWR